MFVFLALLFIFQVLVFMVYEWYKTTYKIDRHIRRFPGPKKVPILGNALQIGNTKTILQNFVKFQKMYGGAYVLNVGPKMRNLVVTDCKLADFLLKSHTLINKSEMYAIFESWCGCGLITSTGNRWRGHRRLLNPAFHAQHLEQYVEVVDSASNVLIEKLRSEVNKDSVDVTSKISLCTLDVILESTMGTSVHAQENVNSEYVQNFHEMFRILIERTFSPLKVFDFTYQFTEDYQIQKRALKIMRDYSTSVIKQRKELLESNQILNGKHSILLDLLLQGIIDDKPLSDEDIRAEVDTFIMAGSDTTAAAINYSLFCLSKYPEEQKKVVEELKQIFEDDATRGATYQELEDMHYLELFIKEALRIYPPVPFISRKLHENVEYDRVHFRHAPRPSVLSRPGKIRPQTLFVRRF